MRTPSEFDEQYTFDAQDPNDPVWAEDSTIAGMQSTDDPNDQYQEKVPVVRMSSGELGFLNDLEEVVESFLENDKPIQPKKPKLEAIRTRELGSDKWRARTTQVTGAMSAPILTESSKRRRVTLTNWGPNYVFLSSVSAVADAPNTMRMLITKPSDISAAFYAPVTICTRDDVWAVCRAGETAQVELYEEFDMES